MFEKNKLKLSGFGIGKDADKAKLFFHGGDEEERNVVGREIRCSEAMLCNMRGRRGDGGRISEIYR